MPAWCCLYSFLGLEYLAPFPRPWTLILYVYPEGPAQTEWTPWCFPSSLSQGGAHSLLWVLKLSLAHCPLVGRVQVWLSIMSSLKKGHWCLTQRLANVRCSGNASWIGRQGKFPAYSALKTIPPVLTYRRLWRRVKGRLSLLTGRGQGAKRNAFHLSGGSLPTSMFPNCFPFIEGKRNSWFWTTSSEYVYC